MLRHVLAYPCLNFVPVQIKKVMQTRSAFRVYGNFIRNKGVPTVALPETCVQMIASWEPHQIKDTFYEYTADLLKKHLQGWQQSGKVNVCRAIYELIVEKEA